MLIAVWSIRSTPTARPAPQNCGFPFAATLVHHHNAITKPNGLQGLHVLSRCRRARASEAPAHQLRPEMRDRHGPLTTCQHYARGKSIVHELCEELARGTSPLPSHASPSSSNEPSGLTDEPDSMPRCHIPFQQRKQHGAAAQAEGAHTVSHSDQASLLLARSRPTISAYLS